jgi:hypothetical protein
MVVWSERALSNYTPRFAGKRKASTRSSAGDVLCRHEKYFRSLKETPLSPQKDYRRVSFQTTGMVRCERAEGTRMKAHDRILRCGVALIFAATFATGAFAQAPAPAEPVTETQKLKDEVERLKAEQAVFEAKFGTLADGIAPKGDTNPTGLSIEGEVIAYATVDTIAGRIATSFKSGTPVPPSGSTIAMFSEPELKMLSEWRAVGAQVGMLEDRKLLDAEPPDPGSCKPSPAVSAMGAPPLAVANVLVQAFSLFRVDRTITGTVVELDEFAVTAQVANKLLAAGYKVVYLPSVYDLTSNGAFTDIEIYKRLKKLKDDMTVEIARTQARRAKIDACPKPLAAPLQNWSATSATFLENRKALLAVVTSMMDEITKPDATGVTRIQAYQRASHIAKLTQGAWLLQIKPIAAAGNVLVSKNILFSKLRFGGGSVISYMLFQPDGQLAKSGTPAAYEGSKKMSEVPSIAGTP